MTKVRALALAVALAALAVVAPAAAQAAPPSGNVTASQDTWKWND